MKAISHFLRTTILGGALFLMPIVVLTFLLNKAFDFARRELKPIAKLIADQLVSEATTETAMAIALIVILCLLAGLLGRTVLTQKIMSRLESAMLSNVPAYGYLKQAGSSMKGLGEIAEPRGARANRGAWRLGIRRVWWGAALPRFSILTRQHVFGLCFSSWPRTRCGHSICRWRAPFAAWSNAASGGSLVDSKCHYRRQSTPLGISLRSVWARDVGT